MNESDIAWAKNEMQIIQSIRCYEDVMANKVYPLVGIVSTNGNFYQLAQSWLKTAREMKKVIENEYKELYGIEKPFDAIHEEYKSIFQRLEENTTAIEYPDEGLKK